MIKRFFLRLPVIMLAVGLIFAGCDMDSLFDKSNADSSAEPLVLTGVSSGKTFTITISQSNSAKAVLTPKGGEYYAIRLVNELVSKGRIWIKDGLWTFTPSSDSPGSKVPYNATYSNGTIYDLTVPGTAISNGQASINGNDNQSGGNTGTNDDDDLRPVLTGVVTIDNKSPRVGNVLTASYSGGNALGTATWQWLRDDVPIPNSSSDQYTVVAADYAEPLKAAVSYTYRKDQVFSSATALVGAFVAVTNITGIPTTGAVGLPLTLAGAVAPENASSKSIAWTISSAGTTQATVSENTISTRGSGIVKLTATITNGKAMGTTYSQDFSIEFKPFVAVTDITAVPASATVDKSLSLTGTVAPDTASSKAIVWTIKDAGTTKATISGSTFKATAEGTATVTATIANGAAVGTNYAKNFEIKVSNDAFIAVTDITGIPTEGTVGTPLTLTGTVEPDGATNKTIAWSVTSVGGTGATISGNSLTTTAAGTVKVTATITDGTAVGTNYTKEFTITVSAAFVAVTGITGIPTEGTVGTLTLNGTVEPSGATNKTIEWTVKDDGTTGATISGNTLTTAAAGIVEVTATIANGTAQGTPYTQDFPITIEDES